MGTAHVDTFARDHLPPRSAWPDLLYTLPELEYPEQLNAAAVLLGEPRFSERACIVGSDDHVDLCGAGLARVGGGGRAGRPGGMVPGNRVLLHGPNSPELIACWFGILLAGGVVVATMPLLRAGELTKVIGKAQVSHALVDAQVAEEVRRAAEAEPVLRAVREYGAGVVPAGGRLRRACPTAQDDVAIIAFTSGTTGQPKGCAAPAPRPARPQCDTLQRCSPAPRRRTTSSQATPPVAFTFGLGGVNVLFPMRDGRLHRAHRQGHLLRRRTLTPSSATPSRPLFDRPDDVPRDAHATPTLSRVASSLRACVSAGEPLPAAVASAWT